MKQISVLATAVVLTASSLLSQGTIYSPPWLATSEGQYYAYYLGYYPDGRFQFGDGHNQSANVLKSLAVRLDNRSYYSSYGAGRSWSNVMITMGRTNLTSFSSTFASNRGGGETNVFSASVTWPTLSGFPLTTPDLWGGLTGAYRFPFSVQSYTHTGGDMMAEFEFTGGTLANNVAWASSSGRYYWFDSFGSPTGTVGSTIRYIPPTRLNNNSTGVTGRCNDSAFGTTTTGAYTYAVATAYGGLYSVYNYRNNLLFYHYSYYTAYDAPVLHGLGLGANDTGIDIFNTGCNKLHFNTLVAILPLRTLPKAASTSGYSGYRLLFLPWSSGLANVKFVMQAYWVDSVTGKPNLAQAVELTTPAAGPDNQIANRASAFYYLKTNATGNFSTSYSYCPAFAYGM